MAGVSENLKDRLRPAGSRGRIWERSESVPDDGEGIFKGRKRKSPGGSPCKTETGKGRTQDDSPRNLHGRRYAPGSVIGRMGDPGRKKRRARVDEDLMGYSNLGAAE